jgi:hypothetical protein
VSGCGGRIAGPKPPLVIAPPQGTYSASSYAADLAAYNTATAVDQVARRNRMVYSIIAEIDYAFYDYETQLFLKEGNFHVGADFVQLGLAAASTLSPAAAHQDDSKRAALRRYRRRPVHRQELLRAANRSSHH